MVRPPDEWRQTSWCLVRLRNRVVEPYGRLAVWPPDGMKSDRQMCINIVTTSFLMDLYKYAFIPCKKTLLGIWITYFTYFSPLLSHPSISWSIVSVWASSAWFFSWFEHSGASDSSSKHLDLLLSEVVPPRWLGGVEIVSPSRRLWRRPNCYCEMCSARLARVVKSNSIGIKVWEWFKGCVWLKVKLLLSKPFLVRSAYFIEK